MLYNCRKLELRAETRAFFHRTTKDALRETAVAVIIETTVYAKPYGTLNVFLKIDQYFKGISQLKPNAVFKGI